jgi:beta-galactosidase
MKILFSVLFLCCCFTVAQAQNNLRERSFDSNWQFKHDDVAKQPENLSLDASEWRKVDLPHDWSVEDAPHQEPDNVVGPFFKKSPTGKGDGYTYGGTGWYRKSFKLTKSENGKAVFVNFDGVYMNSDVWINGHHLGSHPYGYTPFYYELTPYLNPVGVENTIVVKAENKGRNSRWYAGSGIYRHVTLTVVDPLHIDIWGVQVTTPTVSKSSAKVNFGTTITTADNVVGDLVLLTQIVNSKGKLVGETKSELSLKANNKTKIEQNITVKQPSLWSAETPNLYTAVLKVFRNNIEVDKVSLSFGIKDIKIDSKNGLFVNGKRVLLKGGCIHHDNGPLGAISIERAEERKVELLKKNGFNAIRISHNPPSKVLLEVCDRLGMYVVDEAFDVWHERKVADDYHKYFDKYWDEDLTAMIMRDRNHPSVLLWSIGNEIREFASAERLKTAKMLKERVKALDSTRLVTEAVCIYWDPDAKWEDYTPGIFEILEVGGYNYLHKKYETDHVKYPKRIMVGTESYPRDAYEIWESIKRNPYIIGDFVWTAMDYRGEAGVANAAIIPGNDTKEIIKWPKWNAFSGDLDFIGNKKPQSYYRDIVWDKSKIGIMVQKLSIPKGMKYFVNEWGWPEESNSWSFPGSEGDTLQVHVYSKCNIIKLELNGKVIANQEIAGSSITATFKVPYEPGVLVAKGYSDGKIVATSTLKTVGAPAAIKLVADRNKIRADRNDLSYVSVEVVDLNGNLVPYVNDIEVCYTISGNAELAGVGNGSPIDVSSFQQPKKKLWGGKGLAIIRPLGTPGKILLKAKADGLTEGTIEIEAQ